MGLTKVRLGDYLVLDDVRNADGFFGIEAVRGLSVQKTFIKTKADLTGVSLSSYKEVRPGAFCYVPDTSRRGDKICLALNQTAETLLVSGIYVVFQVDRISELLPEYLYMFFNRPEFDRYSRFNSWGSARETFSWEDLCDTVIDLPSIEVQRKYVAIYEAMLANQRAYERGLADIKKTLDMALDYCKHSATTVPLGDLLKESDVRNMKGLEDQPMGLTLSQDYQPSKASLSNPLNYKVVEDGYIAANLIQIGRDAAYPIALNETSRPLLVSPDYKVLESQNRDVARYLVAWFGRSETGRFGWFICDDGVRGRLNIDKFLNLQIPLPDEVLLHAVANLWSAYRKRRDIGDRLRAQLKDICPILIRGSIEEASR